MGKQKQHGGERCVQKYVNFPAVLFFKRTPYR